MSNPPGTGQWHPLSEAQRGRWFLYQLTPDVQGHHNNAFALRLRGRIDVARVRHAVQSLIDRHPMLRSGFRDHGGVPEQCVFDHVDAEIGCVEVGALDDPSLAERVAADGRRAFDLARPPLLPCQEARLRSLRRL